MQLCCLQFGASCHFGAILRNYSKLPCIYILSFPFSPFSFCPMASPIPNVLIAVHSFVKRLHSDLQCKFDHRAAVDSAADFNLSPTASVSVYGIGGLTVPRLARKLRLQFSKEPLPRVIILEIGTNDLSSQSLAVLPGQNEKLRDSTQLLKTSNFIGSP